jgi:hypothetical protein
MVQAIKDQATSLNTVVECDAEASSVPIQRNDNVRDDHGSGSHRGHHGMCL